LCRTYGAEISPGAESCFWALLLEREKQRQMDGGPKNPATVAASWLSLRGADRHEENVRQKEEWRSRLEYSSGRSFEGGVSKPLRGITADTAVRLARFFGTTESFWMNLQSFYEIRAVKKRIAKDLGRIRPQIAKSAA
jgi:hypothetical protein